MLKEATLELRPPKFIVHLLTPARIPGQHTQSRTVTVSSTDSIAYARKTFAAAVCTSKTVPTKYRVWRIPSSASSEELLFPADMLKTCGATLLESDQSNVEDELVDSSEEFVVEFIQRDEWLVNASEVSPSANGAPALPPPPPPPTQSGPLFSSGTDFFSKIHSKTQQQTSPTASTTAVSPFKSGTVVSVSKPGTSARPKVQHDPGTMGLGNMSVFIAVRSLAMLTHNVEGATHAS